MSGAPDSPTLALLTDPALAAADRSAQLVPLVYEELRRMAQRVLLGERPGHTLQATALVHEAFLRLVGPRQLPWQRLLWSRLLSLRLPWQRLSIPSPSPSPSPRLSLLRRREAAASVAGSSPRPVRRGV